MTLTLSKNMSIGAVKPRCSFRAKSLQNSDLVVSTSVFMKWTVIWKRKKALKIYLQILKEPEVVLPFLIF